MPGFAGYIRVSTVRQGERGVSLQEQKDAIIRHAQRSQLTIDTWYEERETAAKRGRPIFSTLIKLLRQGKYAGVVMHKIDRSARNLKDWADLGELIDSGVQVQFVNENIDLTSRGGRLSADIQAVVAADYVRNLREETCKGIRGRYKQGLLPMGAPLGYLDCGGGKPKQIDPVSGPLVRKAFELYATGQYGIRELVKAMYTLGLRTRRGGRVTHNVLLTMLKNPFYMGLLHLKRTGEYFDGVHSTLIGKSLFALVQDRMTGKLHAKSIRHDFTYRRRFVCVGCGRSFIGELQKGMTYYRCQLCPKRCIREETLEQAVSIFLSGVAFTPAQQDLIQHLVTHWKENRGVASQDQRTHLELRLAKIQERLNHLTDALIDQMIDQPTYVERKAGLLMERKELEETMRESEASTTRLSSHVEIFLELARRPQLSHIFAKAEKRRYLLDTWTSNRTISEKEVVFTTPEPLYKVFRMLKTCVMLPASALTSNFLIPKMFDELEKNLINPTKSKPASGRNQGRQN